MAAYAVAASAACDLYAQLEIPALKLLALVPQLRSKGAPMVVERLLNEDAHLASLNAIIGDRSARRLFALPLVPSGAVRQLRDLRDRSTAGFMGCCDHGTEKRKTGIDREAIDLLPGPLQQRRFMNGDFCRNRPGAVAKG